jgi:two-component system chemotaxis response regulator CheY
MGFALDTVRIMVIDDNDFVRETAAAMLGEMGINHVTQAIEGNDALRQLEAADPQLIICDISMKPMDGLEFVEALRSHAWAGAADVPVIFLTVHTEAAIVKRAARLGVKAYVVKPVQKKQLEARVLTVLESQALQQRHPTP